MCRADCYEIPLKDGKPLEGYLSDKEHFNGVLFILREPNSGGIPADTFWMRKVAYGKTCGMTGTARGTRYQNRFSEMLKAIGMEPNDLKNAAYVNVHPEHGSSTVSNAYQGIPRKQLGEIAVAKCLSLNANTVFTCPDIYEGMKEYLTEEGSGGTLAEQVNNLKFCYQRKGEPVQMSRFTFCGACGWEITVYKILHPSRSSRLFPAGDSPVV